MASVTCVIFEILSLSSFYAFLLLCGCRARIHFAFAFLQLKDVSGTNVGSLVTQIKLSSQSVPHLTVEKFSQSKKFDSLSSVLLDSSSSKAEQETPPTVEREDSKSKITT